MTLRSRASEKPSLVVLCGPNRRTFRSLGSDHHPAADFCDPAKDAASGKLWQPASRETTAYSLGSRTGARRMAVLAPVSSRRASPRVAAAVEDAKIGGGGGLSANRSIAQRRVRWCGLLGLAACGSVVTDRRRPGDCDPIARPARLQSCPHRVAQAVALLLRATTGGSLVDCWTSINASKSAAERHRMSRS
jgi:hypothetical protein